MPDAKPAPARRKAAKTPAKTPAAKTAKKAAPKPAAKAQAKAAPPPPNAQPGPEPRRTEGFSSGPNGFTASYEFSPEQREVMEKLSMNLARAAMTAQGGDRRCRLAQRRASGGPQPRSDACGPGPK